MNPEERSDAILGSFDGVVSVIGFIFGLLLHHSPESAIAVGGLGGALSATVSMSTGIYESSEGRWHHKLRLASIMGVSTLVGTLVPVWPFFVFSKPIALAIGSVGCLCVAGWIGFEKHKGWKGYVKSFAILFGAAAFCLAIESIIPN